MTQKPNLPSTLQRVLAEFDKYMDGLYRSTFVNVPREEIMEIFRKKSLQFISQALTESLKEAFAAIEVEKKTELEKAWQEHFYESEWTVDTLTLDENEKKWMQSMTTFLPRHMPEYDWNLPYAEFILLETRKLLINPALQAIEERKKHYMG